MSELHHLRGAELSKVVDRYVLHLQLANQSPRTVETVSYHLQQFASYCNDRSCHRIDDVSETIVTGYRRHLFHRINERTGKPLKPSTQCQHLITLRAFCAWLVKHELLSMNPAAEIELPKVPRRSPVSILNQSEVGDVLNRIDTDRPMGIRNRAILETFYSTGMRASELSAVSIDDVDPQRQLIQIRSGKGDKQRLSPVSTCALDWIQRYVAEVRPKLVRPQTGKTLFIGQRGREISRNRLAQIVKAARVDAALQRWPVPPASPQCGHIDVGKRSGLAVHSNVFGPRASRYHAAVHPHHPWPLEEVHAKTHPTGDDRRKRS